VDERVGPSSPHLARVIAGDEPPVVVVLNAAFVAAVVEEPGVDLAVFERLDEGFELFFVAVRHGLAVGFEDDPLGVVVAALADVDEVGCGVPAGEPVFDILETDRGPGFVTGVVVWAVSGVLRLFIPDLGQALVKVIDDDLRLF
jgi:hypothetical protein